MRKSPASSILRSGSRFLLLAAKIGLSVGLIYFAFSKIDLGKAWLQMRSMPAIAIAGALVLLFLEFFVAALRLRQILAALGTRSRYVQMLDVVLIGAFFSQTLISFVGGDAMRVWRMARSQISLDVATKSVILDRVAGFLALMLLTLLTLPFLLSLVDDPRLRLALFVALMSGTAGAVALVMLRHTPEALMRLKLLRWLAGLSSAAVLLAKTGRRMVVVLCLSVIIHLFNVTVIYVLGSGLSIGLDFGDCLVLTLPVMFMSMLPISVAGWGVREGAMIVALGLVGVDPSQSVALSVYFGLGVLLIGLPGGLLWLVHRGEYGPPQAPAATNEHA